MEYYIVKISFQPFKKYMKTFQTIYGGVGGIHFPDAPSWTCHKMEAPTHSEFPSLTSP